MRGYYNADVTYNYKYINGGASSSFEYTKQDSGSVTSYGGRIVITKYIDSDEATLNLNVLDPRIVGELIEPNAGLDIGLVPFFPVGGGMKVVGKSYIGYRAVSSSELKDIAIHGFRPNPAGSMGVKWFSETEAGAKKFMTYYNDLDTIIKVKVPSSVYNKSYRVKDIDFTGPGFAVPENLLHKLKY